MVSSRTVIGLVAIAIAAGTSVYEHQIITNDVGGNLYILVLLLGLLGVIKSVHMKEIDRYMHPEAYEEEC